MIQQTGQHKYTGATSFSKTKTTQKGITIISFAGPVRVSEAFLRHIEDVASVRYQRSTPLPVGVASRNRTGRLLVGP